MKSDSTVTKQEPGLRHFRLAKQHTQMAQYHHERYQKLKRQTPQSKEGLVKKAAWMGYHHTEREQQLTQVHRLLNIPRLEHIHKSSGIPGPSRKVGSAGRRAGPRLG